MRSMCGADAGCLAINYQSLYERLGSNPEAQRLRQLTGERRARKQRGRRGGSAGPLARPGPARPGRGGPARAHYLSDYYKFIQTNANLSSADKFKIEPSGGLRVLLLSTELRMWLGGPP